MLHNDIQDDGDQMVYPLRVEGDANKRILLVRHGVTGVLYHVYTQHLHFYGNKPGVFYSYLKHLLRVSDGRDHSTVDLG